MTDQKMLNLPQRLLAIMGELKGIEKTGKADQRMGGYTFVEHDNLMAAVHPLLVKYGVFMLPTVLERTFDLLPVPEGRTQQYVTACRVRLTFINADDPNDRLESEAVGDGFDTSDKGPGKAYSYAVKTALLKVFCLPAGTEADNEAHVHEPTVAPRRQAASPASSGGSTPRPALKAFWAKARGEKVPDEVVYAYLERNYGKASSKELSDDSLRDAAKWAAGYNAARASLSAVVKAAGADMAVIEAYARETFGVPSLGAMKLEEWKLLNEYVGNMADDNIPFGNDSADDQGDYPWEATS